MKELCRPRAHRPPEPSPSGTTDERHVKLEATPPAVMLSNGTTAKPRTPKNGAIHRTLLLCYMSMGAALIAYSIS
ncbi:hypothetical protein BC827DRAFT_1196103 [Russula dissimulans]|nr:hypothetical protein BC827DRAFT_1196103 [Russula dissimulans]